MYRGGTHTGRGTGGRTGQAGRGAHRGLAFDGTGDSGEFNRARNLGLRKGRNAAGKGQDGGQCELHVGVNNAVRGFKLRRVIDVVIFFVFFERREGVK